MRIVLFDHVLTGHHLEYASHLSTYLSAAGDEVTFVTCNPAVRLPVESSLVPREDPFTLDCSPPTWIPRAMRPHAAAHRGIHCAVDLASRTPADVLHFLYADRLEISLLLALRRRPRIAAVFSTLFWPHFARQEGRPSALGRRLVDSFRGRALHRLLVSGLLEGLFVHSDRIKEQVMKAMPGDTRSDRIIVVPDPAKEPRMISAEHARTALGLPHGDPVLLFFGATRADKGPDILLRALPLVTGRWITIFAGPSGIVGESEIVACRRRLQEGARLVSRFEFIPEDEADLYFRAADAVVLPYRRSFLGTSGILRRAAASGKPVIASDVGDVGGDVQGSQLGLVVRPESPSELASALNEFLAHRARIAGSVAPRALEYARANDWRILGRLTRERYAQAVAERTSSARCTPNPLDEGYG